MEQESEFLKHIPCEECGSSDGNSLYTDGHTYCFVCNAHKKGETTMNTVVEFDIDKTKHSFMSGQHTAITNRNIKRATCEKWDYMIGQHGADMVHIANYKNSAGETVAQKIRFRNKEFKVLGDAKSMGLYGMHLWASGGKQVVVTEGEMDALSLSQAQNLKWPVVSVPHGAQSAPKAIRKNLEWLLKFDSVVFMFDNDEAGKTAAVECAKLLPPNRAKIAHLPLKDANEMLVAGRSAELLQCMWDATDYRPDGIVAATDLWDQLVSRTAVPFWDFPYSGLNEKLLGLRRGEICTFTAGSGVGKSAFCREISYSLMEQGCKVGYVALEENNDRTLLGFMGIHANKPLHQLPDIVVEQYRDSYDHVAPNLFLYDHWGSTESDNLLDKIRFLVHGCECDVIILDHLSMVVSGVTSDDAADERRLIDNTMTALRKLVEELQCGMILVSHLRRPQGDRGYERGQETSLNSLRGSHAIAQLSDSVIGLERDQQGEQPNVTTIRVLKNRFTGDTGVAGYTEYQRETGRLRELDDPDQAVPAGYSADWETDG